MDIKPSQRSSQFSPTPPQFPETPSGHENEGLWERFQKSRFFPIASIILVAVIVFGLGFAVAGIIRRMSGGTVEPGLGPVKGPENIQYSTGGEAELFFSVKRAAYQSTYNGQVPLSEGRKFVVVSFEIRNEGKGSSGAFTKDDLRLITTDGSIMPPTTWSEGFLNTGVGAGDTKKGEVVFDIDSRNAQLPLTGFQIAFGKNPGSRALYPLSAQ